MHIFIPIWMLYTLVFGGGYAAAKTGVTPTSIQSMFSPTVPPAAPAPVAK